MLFPKENILKAVKSYRGVSVAEIMSPRRGPSCQSGARQEVYYFLREYSEMSYPDIGRYIGGRDHTTILHGVQLVKRRCETNPEYAAEISELRIKVLRQSLLKPVTTAKFHNIDPTNVSYRILHDIEKHGDANVSYEEIIAMAVAVDKAFDVLTGWCDGNPVTDDRLQDMFDALQHPLKSPERIVQ